MNTAAQCPNCGAALAGRFCGECGQPADTRIPSLGRVLAEACADLTNFDSRVWRSLLTLAFQPGQLTRAYLEGLRARYSPPLRLYLVTSVVFFLAFSGTRLADLRPNAAAGAESIDAAAATVDAALRSAGVDPTAVPELEAQLEVARREAAEASRIEAPAPDFGVRINEDGGWECNLDRGLEPRMRARLEAACRKIERDSGASFARAFADNVPLMMLVFIPLVAAIMKVLYLFARRKYVEHLLFFLHVHTFFFLLAFAAIVVGTAANFWHWLRWPAFMVNLATWIYFPIYLYIAMRRVYAQGHALTTVKYVVLGGSYFVAFLLTLLGLVVYTALTL